MNTVECPLCHKMIYHLLVKQKSTGKLGRGFCPICDGELSESQVKRLTAQYRSQEEKFNET